MKINFTKVVTYGFKLKTIMSLLSVLLLTVFSMKALAHGDEEIGRVALEPTSAVVSQISAGAVNYEFDLIDTKTKKDVLPQDLQIVHENLIHLFIFDTSLNEYFHLHPQYLNGKWHATVQMNRNGSYKVFAQGQLTDGEEFTANNDFNLVGGQPAFALPPQLGDNTSGMQGGYKLELVGTPHAQSMSMLTLNFKDSAGKIIDVENYLGAKAHIIATPSDADALIHVHPMEHGGLMMIHIVFPSAGEYRLWVQAKINGQVLTWPLSVNVK